MASRGYTAYLVLRYLTENRSDPNYSIGFTPNYLANHVNGIKTQTWQRMQKILDDFEKVGNTEKLYDGTTKQSHYRITDKGVATYLRWRPVMDEWKEFDF